MKSDKEPQELGEGEYCKYQDVWYCRPPGTKVIGTLRGHQVTEHDDGTITDWHQEKTKEMNDPISQRNAVIQLLAWGDFVQRSREAQREHDERFIKDWNARVKTSRARVEKTKEMKPKKWHTKMSPEGESHTAPSVFSDIYEGDEVIASRIYFDEADKLISRHNQTAAFGIHKKEPKGV